MKLLILVTLFLSPVLVYSTEYRESGNVNFLRSHDSEKNIPLDWFTITGVSQAGSCGTSDGLVVMRLKDDARADRQFSVVMAARLSGQAVDVKIDDENKDVNGFCYVEYVEL